MRSFSLHVDSVLIPLPVWRGIFFIARGSAQAGLSNLGGGGVFNLPAGLNYYTMIGVQSLMDASAASGERSHSS